MTQSCDCCLVVRAPQVNNRPALSQISYRVGTYGSFRDEMLRRISRGGLASLLTRDSDDYSITIMELFAAVADVLTFYQERYAQEFFLRTAVRPESLARLAAMLDYQLRPGTAARAYLAFTIDAGKRPLIPARLRVQSVPETGQRPQTFETLADLQADAALDRVRVYPAPVADNPFALGSKQAYLAPGPGSEVAAAALHQGDRLILVDANAGAVEQIEVDGVDVEDDRFLLRWKAPIQRTGWTPDTLVLKVSRVFRVFGYNAPAQYMVPSAAQTGTSSDTLARFETSGSIHVEQLKTGSTKHGGGASGGGAGGTTTTGQPAGTAGSSVVWNIATNDGTYPDPAQSVESKSLLCLDAAYRGLAPDASVVVSTGSAVYLRSIDAVDQARDTYGGVTSTVSRLLLDHALDNSFDRTTTTVFELVGDPIEFWGYRYPASVTGSTVVVPARRVDATSVEIGRTVVRNKYVTGSILDLDLLSRRDILLEDASGSLTHATISDFSTVPVEVGPTASDALTAAALGLDATSARPVTVLVGAELSVAPSLTKPDDPLLLTIGGVGPRAIRLDLASGDLRTDLQTSINAADPDPMFRDARVALSGIPGPFVIVPGGDHEVRAFIEQGATAQDLGLSPDHAFYASGLVSATLSDIASLDPGKEISVTLAAVGPRLIQFGSAKSVLGQVLDGITSADLAPAFARAQVLLLSNAAHTEFNILLVPGPLAPGRLDYLTLGLAADSQIGLAALTAVMLGNVTLASHGETVRGEVLGSGDASVPFQKFALKKKPVTYLAGAGSAGSRSELEVLVGGVRWDEVASLFAQPSNARVYTARLREDGATGLEFGDGATGAVPPTGQNNIVATYRSGSGLEGRVGKGSLTTLLDRPTGLSAVTNPAAADGGADPESPAGIRRNAPRSVRTFGRAISLRDFEDLVTVSGEVAKARAAWTWDGVNRFIHVTVAGQGALQFQPDSLGRLTSSIASARDSNHPLRLDNFNPVPILVQATVYVDGARLNSTVTGAARQALADALSFDQLDLGQSLDLSDVYSVLQAVQGVTHVTIQQLSFKRPHGMSGADFVKYLQDRNATFLPDGTQDPIQQRLRIRGARPPKDAQGHIILGAITAAEIATITPSDLQVGGIGGLAI